MALQAITNINVDFYDKKYILINAKQLDKGSRFLSVTCYNHGELFPIKSNEHSAYIRYKKPDEHSVFNICEINNKNQIIVELTEQMLVSDGICYADLVVVNKGDAEVNVETGEITGINNTSILSTMTFCIDVSEMPVLNSDIESSYEYDGLNDLLERAEADYEDVVLTAKSWAVGHTGLKDRPDENTDNAKYYCEQAALSESNADESEAQAIASAASALESANSASTSASNASRDAASASTSASSASNDAASVSANKGIIEGYVAVVQSNMKTAGDSAKSASEDAASAHNYYLQVEAITNGLNGAFLPKGTITFAELIELKDSGAIAAGYLYHISDNFTTDENFRVSGKVCGAGTSVYYTVDDKFDVFVGTTVSGVKGETEAEYRTGMVNLTPANIGAIPNADIATVDEIKNYLGI